ncbi:MAG: hypothetical protein ACR2OL_09165, partial [Anderseniella sp.]
DNSDFNEPVNTNYLINQGVSPRVLDFAANSSLQDGSLKENVSVTIRSKEGEDRFQLHSIYDPSYKYGLDIRFVVDGAKTSKKEAKQLSEAIRNLHHFSRLVEQYLYDESTLKTIKNENGEVVLEFYYRNVAVDPSMKHIKRLKGYIHFENGVLNYVELVNTKPLKKGMDNYKRKSYFKRPIDGSGYIVSHIIETYEVGKADDVAQIEVESFTKEFSDVEGNIVFSNDSHNQVIENPDTLEVKLGGPLPLMGKPATKFGYRLPRPVGINALLHFQEQELQFTGLSIGMNGGDMVSLSDVFLLDDSNLSQTTAAYQAKADVWVLPFLNIMGLAGRAENSIDGNLVLTDEIKALMGILGIDAPDDIPIQTDVSANLFGVGATLAAGLSDFNFTLSGQYILAHTPDVNVTTNVFTATAMVGYMLPFGMNVMGGTQGQFYEPGMGGSIDLGDGNNLDFLVEFEPKRWNFFGGVYKGFGKHWEVSMQVGVGPRSSLTTMLGYRF